MWYNRSTLRGNEFNYTGVQLQIHGGSNFVSKKEKEASLLLPLKKKKRLHQQEDIRAPSS
jgi:DNA polymerase sigma